MDVIKLIFFAITFVLYKIVITPYRIYKKLF